MTFIGAKVLLEMQRGDVRKLIRHHRNPLFFPWRPVPRPKKETGSAVFISAASDLSVWRREDAQLLEDLNAPLRLVRPGTMNEPQLLALPPTVDCYLVDVWCCDEATRGGLLEILLPQMQPLTNSVM